MQNTPLRFIPVGYGYGVNAMQIAAVLLPDTAPSKRIQADARKTDRYVDMTCGHAVKCLLLMLDSQVIGCAVKSRTMIARLNSYNTNTDE